MFIDYDMRRKRRRKKENTEGGVYAQNDFVFSLRILTLRNCMIMF